MTLGQFQRIWAVQNSELDNLDKLTEFVAIMTNKNFQEVEALPMAEFNKHSSKAIETLSTPYKAKPQKTIGGYGICYEPGKLNRGQYVTVQHLIKDPIGNAHKILSAISYDVKTKKNDTERFNEIALEIQETPFELTYSACVFFCQLFNVSTNHLVRYLTRKKGKLRQTLSSKDITGYGRVRTLQS